MKVTAPANYPKTITISIEGEEEHDLLRHLFNHSQYVPEVLYDNTKYAKQRKQYI